ALVLLRAQRVRPDLVGPARRRPQELLPAQVRPRVPEPRHDVAPDGPHPRARRAPRGGARCGAVAAAAPGLGAVKAHLLRHEHAELVAVVRAVLLRPAPAPAADAHAARPPFPPAA